MEKTEITIVGAGVVGLAIAAVLSKRYQDILIVERNDAFGRETSSRNSEVIHAGIYYPKDSLKARLCVEGRELLYRFCKENNVRHRRIGKLIVAAQTDEIGELQTLLKKGHENGAADLRWLTRDECRRLEAGIHAEAAVYSPSTGIIDTHGFMQKLSNQFTSRNGMVLYQNEVVAIARHKDGFIVTVRGQGEESKLFTRVLINAAGLSSDKIAAMAGAGASDYTLKYCKGDYFRVRGTKAQLISRLIYPVPTQDHIGLGVHATLDLAGQMRLGPDTEYIEKIDYTVSPTKQKMFYESARKILPFIEMDDLTPDMAGVRPKIQGPGEPVKDFIIKNESERSFPNLINLIGIESPGLTASLAIGRRVKDLVQETI